MNKISTRFFFFRLVHLDLKGAPPRTCYFEKVYVIRKPFEALSLMHFNTLYLDFKKIYNKYRGIRYFNTVLSFDDGNILIIDIFLFYHRLCF